MKIKRLYPRSEKNILLLCPDFLLSIRMTFMILIAMSLLHWLRSDSNILAVIGKRTITADDFTTRFQSLREKLSLADNWQTRKETLQKMID